MKKIILLLLILVKVYASENIYQAHQAYDQGDYDKALGLYQKEKSKSAAAYYNLGNIYFRKGELGEAIFFFKEARGLAPRDGDIEYNLNYLRKKTLDKIENKKNGLANIITLRHFFNQSELLIFISLGAFLFWGLSFLYIYKRSDSLLWIRRAIFVIVFLCGLIAIKDWSYDQDEGVVISPKINVYSAIGRDNVVLFTLHEGAEFSYQKLVDNSWVQITIADGKKGWIKKEHAFLEGHL